MRFCTLFIALALMLSACGIKPGNVEPPEGTKNDTFPQVYPNLSTDPAP